MKYLKWILHVGLCVVLMPGCAHSRKNAAINSTEPEISQMASSSDEFSAGQQIHDEILRHFRPYTEPDAVSYVNALMMQMAAHSERKELAYSATILYDDQIYATSAPGGHVYLTTGFIYFLENEAELAAVLAHEIGQLQYKDPRLSKSKKILNNMMTTGAAVAPAFGTIGMLAVLGMAMVQMTTDAEDLTLEERLVQSDQKAMRYMAEAGFDPQGMIDLMYKFLQADKTVVPYFKNYYDARPITAERMQAIQNTFKELPLQDRTFSTNREHFLTMTKGVREIYSSVR